MGASSVGSTVLEAWARPGSQKGNSSSQVGSEGARCSWRDSFRLSAAKTASVVGCRGPSHANERLAFIVNY